MEDHILQHGGDIEKLMNIKKSIESIIHALASGSNSKVLDEDKKFMLCVGKMFQNEKIKKKLPKILDVIFDDSDDEDDSNTIHVRNMLQRNSIKRRRQVEKPEEFEIKEDDGFGDTLKTKIDEKFKEITKRSSMRRGFKN